MTEKNRLESFIVDIDKIISGELVTAGEHTSGDEEYQELLSLAQLLTQANNATENPGLKERIWSNIQKNGELEDNDLDMVAGGLNLNAVLEEKNKK
ncbi:hypothetical protein ASZ90_019994 [hydrocarbon metagenome]|uniref:Uncharacterized protein n=1 Tax=hydrocarbon metagenome TaxID=938273 RepID=A0A0W8E1X0_9ZZZZ